MFPIRRLVLVLALCGPCATPLDAQEAPTAEPVPQENLHLYLLIGQSNMAGRAPFTDAEAAPIPRCFLLNDKEEWVPAANPLNQYSSVRKRLGMQKMNPGYGFAKTTLARTPGASLGLIVNARGGTRIEQWAKGTKYYKQAVRRTRAALKSGTLKGVLWHQGEGNSGAPEGYAEKLKELVLNLRQDLDAPDLPFVAGQIVGDKTINDEIARLPEIVPHTAFASSQGLTAFDRSHFDAASMKTLGDRYAEAMLRLQERPAAADEQPATDAATATER